MAENRTTAKASSFSMRIGNTTYIVSAKQSDTARKPIEKVFEDMCRHEVAGDFFTNSLLSLEELQKTS